MFAEAARKRVVYFAIVMKAKIGIENIYREPGMHKYEVHDVLSNLVKALKNISGSARDNDT